MKGFLTAFLSLAVAVCASAVVMAADTPVFSDVDESTVQGQAIMKMYNKGYLAGYNDGTFRPDGEVTRAELVRIINQVFGYEEKEVNTVDFSDNTNNQAWYYKDVRIAQQRGYVSGFGDNTFRPQDNFTRQQACVVLTIITRADAKGDTVTITDSVAPWALNYVNTAISSGLFELEENNTFRATQNITRGELCVALASFVKEEASTESTTSAVTETASETTTRRTTGGGSGSSGGSSSGQTTTTTEATTETTTAVSGDEATETTTIATTEVTTQTTTNAPITTTEATTELTTAETVSVSNELISAVKRTARNLTRYVATDCSTDAQKAVANSIADAMNSFVADTSFDVESAAKEAMVDYQGLSSTEKEQLKNLIVRYCAISDLVLLRDTFFPGLEY